MRYLIIFTIIILSLDVFSAEKVKPNAIDFFKKYNLNNKKKYRFNPYENIVAGSAAFVIFLSQGQNHRRKNSPHKKCRDKQDPQGEDKPHSVKKRRYRPKRSERGIKLIESKKNLRGKQNVETNDQFKDGIGQKRCLLGTKEPGSPKTAQSQSPHKGHNDHARGHNRIA